MGDGHKNEQKKNPELFSNCIEHLRLTDPQNTL